MPVPAHIRDILTRARLSTGDTEAEFAARLGLSDARVIAAVERGECRTEDALRVCKLLALALDSLFPSARTAVRMTAEDRVELSVYAFRSLGPDTFDNWLAATPAERSLARAVLTRKLPASVIEAVTRLLNDPAQRDALARKPTE